MKSSLPIFLLSALLLVSGCATFFAPSPDPSDQLDGPLQGEYGVPVIRLSVPVRLTVLQVRQSILNAAVENRWQVMESGFVGDDGIVRTRKTGFNYETNFTYIFSSNAVECFSESYLLGFDGKRKKRFTPQERIDSMRKTIKKNLESQIAAY